MRPCGLDLRERIVRAYENGEGSVRDLAEQFEIAPKTVQSYLTLYRTTGSVAPRPRINGPRPKLDGQALDDLRSLVATTSDATLDELADQLARRDRVAASRHTVGRALRRLNITRKKKALHATERDTEEVTEARRAFAKQIAQLDPHDLVFIDEFGTNLGMTRRHAWVVEAFAQRDVT